MKKAVLILALVIAAALVSWYIFDPGSQDGWIGHQSDDVQALQPEEKTASSGDPAAIEAADAISSSGSQASGAHEQVEWELVWSDEFDAPLLSMEYWTEVDRKDNYNAELQYYSTENSYIEDGCLVLTAKDEHKDGKQYTSGMVQTEGKLDMRYGRIEARISLPVAQGIFPAFWLSTGNGENELDILEMVGCEPGNIYGVCHYIKLGDPAKTYGMVHVDDPEAFHVYALEWDEDEVRWYVDGEQFFSSRAGVPDEAMFILFTLAVGGEWPGSPDDTTPFPLSMRVDYIRLYCPEGTHDIA